MDRAKATPLEGIAGGGAVREPAHDHCVPVPAVPLELSTDDRLHRRAMFGACDHVPVIAWFLVSAEESHAQEAASSQGSESHKAVAVANRQQPGAGLARPVPPPRARPRGRLKRRGSIVGGKELRPLGEQLGDVAVVKCCIHAASVGMTVSGW
jgi:hypothetical protein